MGSRGSALHANVILILLRLAGLIPWRVKGVSGLASKLFILHSKIAYLVIIGVQVTVIWKVADLNFTLKFCWRVFGASTLLCQNLLISRGTKLVLQLVKQPIKVKEAKCFRETLRKKTIWKFLHWSCIMIPYFCTILLRKYHLLEPQNQLKTDSKIENFIANQLIVTPSLILVYNSYIVVVLLHIAINVIAMECLLLYLLTLTLCAIQHLHHTIKEGHFRDIPLDVLQPKQKPGLIKYCVKLHQKIISLVDLINQVYSISMLIIVWRSFGYCVTAYEVGKRVDLSLGIEVFNLFVICMMQLLTVGWMADNITLEGTNLASVCVERAWYGTFSDNRPSIAKLSPDRRSLLVIAARSRIPLELKAGPFYRLSVGTFKAILGVCFSYFMFFFTLTKRHRNDAIKTEL